MYDRPAEAIATLPVERRINNGQHLVNCLKHEQNTYMRKCVKRVLRNMGEGKNSW